jgi:hypothetical protein
MSVDFDSSTRRFESSLGPAIHAYVLIGASAMGWA